MALARRLCVADFKFCNLAFIGDREVEVCSKAPLRVRLEFAFNLQSTVSYGVDASESFMAYRFIGEPLEIAGMAIIKKNSIRIKQLLPCFTVSRLQRINGRFYNWVI
jgi:hypothetical protein